MARLAPSYETIKALLARSGNQCAFPNCSHPLLNNKNKLIAQLCHIEAANVGGERFNANKFDEDRRDYSNLMFMCYRHHIETNDTEEFTVQRLQEIKRKHEAKYQESIFLFDDETIIKEVKREIEKYWIEVKHIHSKENTLPSDLKMDLNFDLTTQQLIGKLRNHFKSFDKLVSILWDSNEILNNDFKKVIKSIDVFGILAWRIKKIPYYKNPFLNRDWVYFNIGFSNLSTITNITLNQLELRVMEEELLKNPEDKNISKRINELRIKLNNQARNTGYID